MESSDEPRAVSSMFAGSHHQSLHNPEFKVAGRDIYASTIAPTINVSFGLAHGTVSPGSSNQLRPLAALPIASGMTPALHKTQSPSPLAQLLVTLRRLILQDNSLSSKSPPEQTEIHTLDESVREPPAYLTTPDVYVLNMLRTGKGLACWQPRPRKPLANKCGTVPGDVGIFAAESGFKKLFNLWDDDEAVRKTGRGQCSTAYRLPERNVVVAKDVLVRGDAVAQGTSSLTSWTDDGHVIKSFEFECRSSQGAILAITSPADLEEITDHTALREHIGLNAELLYRHASAICRIANNESLYIITGSIKSESWALAAFNDPTTSSADVLRLIKRPGDHHPSPDFMWTHRATSEARVGRGEVLGTKDQSLFLRGFKLDFSDAFRARMDSVKLSTRSAEPEGNHNSPDVSGSVGSTDTTLGGINNPHGPFEGNVRSPGGQTGSGFSVIDVQSPPYSNRAEGDLYSDDAGIGVRVTPLTPTSHYRSYHPCDLINGCMLETTGADFALSHDDDWRELLNHFNSEESVDWREEVDSIDSYVFSENGVAYFDASAILAKADSDASSLTSRLAPSATRTTQTVGTAGHMERENVAESCSDAGNLSEAVHGTPTYSMSGGDVLDMQQSRSHPGQALPNLPTQEDDGFESDVQLIPDSEEKLRQNLALDPNDPISLWSLPDPEPGQRPPHPYPLLCKLAIYGSPTKRLTLKGIYDAIEERFEYYRNQPKGVWKGSIRHNLSLIQEFRNVPRSPAEPGNGDYWVIDHTRGEGYETVQAGKKRKGMIGDESRAWLPLTDNTHAGFGDYELGITTPESSQLGSSVGRAGPSSSLASTTSSSIYARELEYRHRATFLPSKSKSASSSALTRALELARQAVQLDSANDSPDAVVRLYGQSVALLGEAIQTAQRGKRSRVTQQEDEVRRLQSIRETYVERIAFLRSLHNNLEVPSVYPTALPLPGSGSPTLALSGYDDILSQLQNSAARTQLLSRGS